MKNAFVTTEVLRLSEDPRLPLRCECLSVVTGVGGRPAGSAPQRMACPALGFPTAAAFPAHPCRSVSHPEMYRQTFQCCHWAIF